MFFFFSFLFSHLLLKPFACSVPAIKPSAGTCRGGDREGKRTACAQPQPHHGQHQPTAAPGAPAAPVGLIHTQRGSGPKPKHLGLLARSPKAFIPQCLSPFTALPLASPPPPGAVASVLGSLHLKGTGRWGLPGAAATPCGVPAPNPALNPASTPAPMPGRCCSEEAARVLPQGRDFLAQAEKNPGLGHKLCQNTPGKGGRRSCPREAFLPRSHTWGSSGAVGVGTTVPGGTSVQIQLPTGLVRQCPGPRLCTAWPQPPGLPSLLG